MTASLETLLSGWGVRGAGMRTRDPRNAYPPDRRPPGEVLGELGRLLIQPIADLLPREQGAHLTVIPQDDLHLVPFSALPLEQGVLLLDRYAVTLASSLRSLEVIGAQPVATECRTAVGALVVGNPEMPTLKKGMGAARKLAPLAGAQLEALDVARLLRSHALVREHADKLSVTRRIERARLIHFATHGIADDVDASFSGLALTPSNTDEGFLTRRELQSLHLCAEMTVLSACGTGAGPLGSDGLASLSNVFMAAGVPSVVMALWSIDDESTAEFMHAFYLALSQGLDRAAALRQAAQSVRRRHPDPRHWAGMTLMGLATSLSDFTSMQGDTPLESTAVARSPLDDFPIPQGAFQFHRQPASGPDSIGNLSFLLPAPATVDEVCRTLEESLKARGFVQVRGPPFMQFRRKDGERLLNVNVIPETFYKAVIVSAY